MKEVILGLEENFHLFPVEVTLDRLSYYLLKAKGIYRLVSRSCPHAGQMVEFEDEELVCPMHGWCFDPHTGACLNVPSKGLNAYDVVVRDGQLVAQMLD